MCRMLWLQHFCSKTHRELWTVTHMHHDVNENELCTEEPCQGYFWTPLRTTVLCFGCDAATRADRSRSRQWLWPHLRLRGAFQKRPRGNSLLWIRSCSIFFFLFTDTTTMTRVHLHRADQAGHEVRHTNCVEKLVDFHNKTPSANFWL